MNLVGVARRRLVTQRVAGTPAPDPAAAVAWLGAVQAQDYLGALWAIGLRTRSAVEADVERAIAARAVVRTWPMRGTLHLVAAADVRWMLALLAPRAVAARTARLAALGIDGATLARSEGILGRALAGGRRLPRAALYAALARGGVSPAGQRGIHVLARLSQEGVLCGAGRDGKQQTFALLDAWVPPARPLAREEALARLARRYFAGHGPAALDDLAWWAGLAAGDARDALALARPHLEREVVAGRELWWAGEAGLAPRAASTTRLLPPFDELLVGYRDRTASLDRGNAPRLHALLSPAIVSGARVVGTWTRRLVRGSVAVRPSFFDGAPRPSARALEAAAEEYGRFLGRAAVVEAPRPRARRSRAARRAP